MDIDVDGAPDLIETFAKDVRSVFRSKGNELPFSSVLLMRDPSKFGDVRVPTLGVVVYGSASRSVPTRPWNGQVRYENDWNVAVPIFDRNARPIAELTENNLLFILVPLSLDKSGGSLLKMILADAIKIIRSENNSLESAEQLLLKSCRRRISSTVPKIFSEFCGCITSSSKDPVGEYDRMAAQVESAYHDAVKESYNILLECQVARVIQSIEELGSCAGVRRAFYCRGTLYVESTEIPTGDNGVLRLYWNPHDQNAQCEASGFAVDTPGEVFQLLETGQIFEAFSEFCRIWKHPYFEGVNSNHKGLNLSLIQKDPRVKVELDILRKKACKLSQIVQDRKSMLNVTGYVRRWYLLSQALALTTMDQFASVEFKDDLIKLTADDVINRRDGGLRRLGKVFFYMSADDFYLQIQKDIRQHSCKGEAEGNYRRAVREGHLVACAEILWQHVTVG